MMFNVGELESLIGPLCPQCGMILRVGDWPTCPHDSTKDGRVFSVSDDSIPGGMTVENMGPQPETFYSKSDWKRRMKELGLVNMVRHVPKPGSDKSDKTSRWV